MEKCVKCVYDNDLNKCENCIGYDNYDEKEQTRNHNIGNSDYANHKIQVWDIWLEYNLNPWDADIVKRVLRNKEGDPRRLDYEKIIYIAQERIRQIDEETT